MDSQFLLCLVRLKPRFSSVCRLSVATERARCGAEFLTCTEKDLYNLPADWRPPVPLRVPRVAALLDEPDRFFSLLADMLRPRLVVASNGYGEDAIGVLLAERLRTRFPASEVLTFPLVGRGDAYRAADCGSVVTIFWRSSRTSKIGRASCRERV